MCSLMAEICWSSSGESFTSPGPGKAPGACPGEPPVNVTERHQSWLQRLRTGSSLTPPVLKAPERSLMLSPVPMPKALVNPSRGSLYLAVVLLCAGEPVGEQKEREGIRQCGGRRTKQELWTQHAEDPLPHHQSLLSKTLLCHWGESRCVKEGRIHEETAQTAERPGKAGH